MKIFQKITIYPKYPDPFKTRYLFWGPDLTPDMQVQTLALEGPMIG